MPRVLIVTDDGLMRQGLSPRRILQTVELSATAFCALPGSAYQDSQCILASCTKHHNSDTLRFCRISRALMIGYEDLVYRCDKRTARIRRFVCWKRRSEPSSTARTKQMASPNRTTYSV